ncbi:MAG: radical SAM protein [Candidatus Zixiibacteriota bacterium]
MSPRELVDRQKYLQEHPQKVREAIQERNLRLIGWEITKECDMDCLHCGNPEEWKENEGPDLTTDQAKRIFKEIAEDFEPEKLTVALTGGELTLRPDLMEIIRFLSSLGFRVALSTNGYFLGKNLGFIDELIKAKTEALALSIDGNKGSHNKQRKKRSFGQVVKAIKYLRTRYPDLYLQITTVVTSLNFADLPQIHDLLVQLDVRDWKICHLIPIGRAKTRPDLQISEEQTFQLLSWISSLNNRFRQEKSKLKVSLACEGWCGEEFEGRIRDFLFLCTAGIQSATITHDGKLGGCLEISRELSIQGDLLKQRFKDVWENEFRRFTDKEWLRDDAHCQACDAWDFCQGGAIHQRTREGKLIECLYLSLKDKKERPDVVNQLEGTEIEEVEFNPLLKTKVEGRWIVGQEDTGTYGEFPEVGVRILEQLEQEKNVKKVTDKVYEETRQSYDIQDFIRSMLSSGFVKSVNGMLLDREKLATRKIESVFNRINPKLFSWILSWPVAVISSVIVALALILMISNPALRPHYRYMIVSNFFTLTGFAVVIAGAILASKHELFHFFAARKYGVKSAFRLSTRLYLLVMETDVSNAWVLPKRKKLIVYLVGAFNDIVTLSILVILLYLGSSHSWLARLASGANGGVLGSLYGFLSHPWFDKLAKLFIFSSFYMIVFQCMFYMRTDFYYAIAHSLNCRNLMEDTKTFIYLRVILPALKRVSGMGIAPFRNKMNSLIERTKDTRLTASPHELKVIRFYAPFFALGVSVMLWFFIFNLLPVLLTLYVGAFGTLIRAFTLGAATVGWRNIADASTFIFIHVAYYGTAAYLINRSRKRKAQLSLVLSTP